LILFNRKIVSDVSFGSEAKFMPQPCHIFSIAFHRSSECGLENVSEEIGLHVFNRLNRYWWGDLA